MKLSIQLPDPIGVVPRLVPRFAQRSLDLGDPQFLLQKFRQQFFLSLHDVTHAFIFVVCSAVMPEATRVPGSRDWVPELTVS